MSNKLVVVTGGCGYIGSHTIVELIHNGFNVVSIDNYSRSSNFSLECVYNITGVKVKNYDIDLNIYQDIVSVFEEIGEVFGVIHFAAFKSVPESIVKPELYYSNNINSLVNILNICKNRFIFNMVFSSSCSVYGDILNFPVNEKTKLSEPKSPYAFTKVIGEKLMLDFHNAHKINGISLRYFNPVGAHTSGLLGELSLLKSDNLIPVITQTAIGIRNSMQVYGGNLNTRDGSCIRDYVHVMDIATAHVLALNKIANSHKFYEIINLGTGNGISVFEAIKSFENISGVKLNYSIAEARDGDVFEIYSDNQKANSLLGWFPKHDLDEMISSAWNWQLELQRLGK